MRQTKPIPLGHMQQRRGDERQQRLLGQGTVPKRRSKSKSKHIYNHHPVGSLNTGRAGNQVSRTEQSSRAYYSERGRQQSDRRSESRGQPKRGQRQPAVTKANQVCRTEQSSRAYYSERGRQQSDRVSRATENEDKGNQL
jgi:hypothetical protein